MRKFLWAVGLLIVLMVAAVLVGPNFVNWNDYKGQIAQEVRNLTGRQLAIRGDIRITVLPAPAVVVGDVSLSNAEGAASDNMVRLKSAEVRIALAPLLGGKIKVETVRLIDPVIELEALPDGRKNWEFPAMAEDGAKEAGEGAASAPAGTDASAAPAVTLDDFTIVNGTVIYRDTAAGMIERADAINARIEAASLTGPFQLDGGLTARSIPFRLRLNVGEVIQERTLPINLEIGLSPGDTILQMNGTVVGLTGVPKLKGKVSAKGGDVAAIIEAINGGSMPPLLRQPFKFEGGFTASAKGAEIKGFTVSLGDSSASGDVAVDLGDITNAALSLSAKHVDLDAWLKAVEGGGGAEAKKAAEETGGTAGSLAVPPKKADSQTPGPAFSLPADVAGSAILSVDTVAFRGDVIQDFLLNADLRDGKIELGQLSAQLPGGSDVAVFGALTATADGPSFSGEVESTVNDLRTVLKWLGTDLEGVPADRLRKMSVTSKIDASRKLLRARELDFRFDSSRLTGAATVALRDRLSFGANLTLDRIDVDAYLPPAAEGAASSAAAAGTASAEPQDAETGAEKTAAPNPFAALSALTNFDANLKAHVKTLVFRGDRIKDIVVDGTLYNGSFDIRRMSVQRFAGATATVKGKLHNLGGVPKAEALQFSGSTKDVSPLVRLAGAQLPVDSRKLGAVSVKGRIDGALLKPAIDVTANAAGAAVAAKGKLSVLPVADMFDLNVGLSHKNFTDLLRIAGVAYRPAGKIGKLDIRTRIKGSPEKLALSDLRGNIGKMSLGGAVSLDLRGAKPRIGAAIKTGAVVVDDFLPAEKSAALKGIDWAGLVRRPAGLSLPARTKTANPLLVQAADKRWPTDPLDLSVLDTFDGDISLRAPLVIFGKYLFEKADVAFQIANGALSTSRLKGILFGGNFNGGARLSTGRQNSLATKFTLADMKIAEGTKAVTGEAVATGDLNADADLRASGRSVAELVSTLAGTAAMDMKSVDVAKGAKGSSLAGVLDLLTALNRIGSGDSGTSADVSGTFQISNGVARTNDLRIASGIGNGGAAGTVDLAGWRLNLAGEVELGQSVLTKILQAKVRETRNAVKFNVSGPLDAPDVKVDTAALLGSTVPVPAADLLLNKAPKGVGGVLKKILKEGQSPPPADQGSSGSSTQQEPPPARNQPSGSGAAPVVEDLLKKIFK